MNNGISGYNAGRINPYRQVEKRLDVPVADESGSTIRQASMSSGRVDLGTDLSEAEAGMIDHKFPESERMKLRLYGPGRDTSTVDPGSRGRRLDLQG